MRARKRKSEALAAEVAPVAADMQVALNRGAGAGLGGKGDGRVRGGAGIPLSPEDVGALAAPAAADGGRRKSDEFDADLGGNGGACGGGWNKDADRDEVGGSRSAGGVASRKDRETRAKVSGNSSESQLLTGEDTRRGKAERRGSDETQEARPGGSAEGGIGGSGENIASNKGPSGSDSGSGERLMSGQAGSDKGQTHPAQGSGAAIDAGSPPPHEESLAYRAKAVLGEEMYGRVRELMMTQARMFHKQQAELGLLSKRQRALLRARSGASDKTHVRLDGSGAQHAGDMQGTPRDNGTGLRDGTGGGPRRRTGGLPNAFDASGHGGNPTPPSYSAHVGRPLPSEIGRARTNGVPPPMYFAPPGQWSIWDKPFGGALTGAEFPAMKYPPAYLAQDDVAGRMEGQVKPNAALNHGGSEQGGVRPVKPMAYHPGRGQSASPASLLSKQSQGPRPMLPPSVHPGFETARVPSVRFGEQFPHEATYAPAGRFGEYTYGAGWDGPWAVPGPPATGLAHDLHNAHGNRLLPWQIAPHMNGGDMPSWMPPPMYQYNAGVPEAQSARWAGSGGSRENDRPVAESTRIAPHAGAGYKSSRSDRRKSTSGRRKGSAMVGQDADDAALGLSEQGMPPSSKRALGNTGGVDASGKFRRHDSLEELAKMALGLEKDEAKAVAASKNAQLDPSDKNRADQVPGADVRALPSRPISEGITKGDSADLHRARVGLSEDSGQSQGQSTGYLQTSARAKARAERELREHKQARRIDKRSRVPHPRGQRAGSGQTSSASSDNLTSDRSLAEPGSTAGSQKAR